MNSACPISHNWPQEDFCLSVFSGISQIKRVEPHKGGNGGGIRANVKNFSRQSRKRLLERMAKSRNMDAGYFTTFTYPGLFTYTAKECKAHLAAMRKRIARHWPQARGIWRMEIKERLSGDSKGLPVPHYHILLFGIPYGHESDLALILGQMWNEIANNRVEDFPLLRTDCSQIRSRKHAIFYASKYAAKIDDNLFEGFGRHWGFFGEWDESESLRIIVNQTEVIQLKRLIRSWLKSKNRLSLSKLFSSIRPDYGLSIFGLGDNDDPEASRSLITDMLIHISKL